MQNSPKRIIIVGATSGIGRRVAELYAEKQNMVGITGRRNELLKEIQQQFPEKIITECFDVTGTENISAIQSLVNKLGGLDLLIYSSGIGQASKELSWQIDKLTVDTNVNGFIEIANWGFNYFVKQGHGTLVTISSIASIRGNSWAPAYNASKAFQSSYFEGLAIKAARMKKDIAVISIEPGYVKTDMAKGAKIFWALSNEKACRMIVDVIEKNKRKSQLSIRWWFVAGFLRIAPYWLYKRLF
jgi:short-subunit dehydrogenase